MFKKNLFADIKAGIVVFLVALPLCLGIAMACKVPLFSGIIAGVSGGILVTIFSGSSICWCISIAFRYLKSWFNWQLHSKCSY